MGPFKYEKTDFNGRFLQKDLADAFFVLGMRGINMGSEDSAKEFANAEVKQLAQHFGEEKASSFFIVLSLNVNCFLKRK